MKKTFAVLSALAMAASILTGCVNREEIDVVGVANTAARSGGGSVTASAETTTATAAVTTITAASTATTTVTTTVTTTTTTTTTTAEAAPETTADTISRSDATAKKTAASSTTKTTTKKATTAKAATTKATTKATATKTAATKASTTKAAATTAKTTTTAATKATAAVTTASSASGEAAADSAASARISDTIIAEGIKLLGSSYGFGGKRPSTFDCSGFVQYALRKAGVRLSVAEPDGSVTAISNVPSSLNKSSKISVTDTIPTNTYDWGGLYKYVLAKSGRELMVSFNGKTYAATLSKHTPTSDKDGNYWLIDNGGEISKGSIVFSHNVNAPSSDHIWIYLGSYGEAGHRPANEPALGRRAVISALKAIDSKYNGGAYASKINSYTKTTSWFQYGTKTPLSANGTNSGHWRIECVYGHGVVVDDGVNSKSYVDTLYQIDLAPHNGQSSTS